jgi:hypothetical protein
MRRALAIVKYLPAVLCGLLVGGYILLVMLQWDEILDYLGSVWDAM